MSRISWLTKTRQTVTDTVDPEIDLSGRLRSLEKRAKKAPFGAAAYAYNVAGDLCASAARSRDAKQYFGQAIDSFLDTGRLDVAGAVARKVLRLYPDVVRARSTLVWIAIGRGIRPEVLQALRSYADAALARGMEEGLIRELERMGGVVTDREVLEEIAWLLLDLGAAAEANNVYGRAFGVEPGEGPVSLRWETVASLARDNAWRPQVEEMAAPEGLAQLH